MTATELVELVGPEVALAVAEAGEGSMVPSRVAITRELSTRLACALFCGGASTNNVQKRLGCSSGHARRLYRRWARNLRETAH